MQRWTGKATISSGIAAFWGGEFPGARNHFEAVIQRFGAVEIDTTISFASAIMSRSSASAASRIRWASSDASRPHDERAIESLALAERAGHPFTLGWALFFGALLSLDLNELEAMSCARGETDRARRRASVGTGCVCRERDVWTLPGDRRGGRRGSSLLTSQARHDSRSVDAAPGMSATLLRLLLTAQERSGDAAAEGAVADEAIADVPRRPHVASSKRGDCARNFSVRLDRLISESEAELARASTLFLARRRLLWPARGGQPRAPPARWR